MTDTLDRAGTFLHTNARVLERRVLATVFEGASPDGVMDALRAYRNDDGGFGHGLEADLRSPHSQPICVASALKSMRDAGASDEALVQGACGFLASVASADGAVSPALPGASEFPCADHFALGWAVIPGVNPTAMLAGLLHSFGARHPWLDRATEWCLGQLERGVFESAHTLHAATTLLEHMPDRDRAAALIDRIAGQIPRAEWYVHDAPVTTYGMTPLHFAPSPEAPLRERFADDAIEAHLDDLMFRQQPDGGWPIHWTPPGPGAALEWRGRWTLDALLVLRAYERI